LEEKEEQSKRPNNRYKKGGNRPPFRGKGNRPSQNGETTKHRSNKNYKPSSSKQSQKVVNGGEYLDAFNVVSDKK